VNTTCSTDTSPMRVTSFSAVVAGALRGRVLVGVCLCGAFLATFACFIFPRDSGSGALLMVKFVLTAGRGTAD